EPAQPPEGPAGPLVVRILLDDPAIGGLRLRRARARLEPLGAQQQRLRRLGALRVVADQALEGGEAEVALAAGGEPRALEQPRRPAVGGTEGQRAVHRAQGVVDAAEP